MATFTVTNLNDSGAGSLRQAIADANATADADTIEFASGITGGNTAGINDGVIRFGGVDISITNDLTIMGDVDGDGVADITLTGDANSNGSADAADSRLFNISATGTEVALRSLTMDIGFGGTLGGGLVLAGTDTTVSVVNSTLSNGLVTDNGKGGALLGDAIFLANTSVVDNTAGIGGGVAIRAGGVGYFDNVTMAGNTSTYVLVNGGQGGAAIVDFGSILTVRNSTITDNVSDGNGGGISVFNTGSLNVFNSILSGNTSQSGSDQDIGRTGAPNQTIIAEHSVLGSTAVLDGGSDNVISDAPGLAALAIGPSGLPTLALLAGSPAAGIGDASLLPADTADVDGDGDTGETLPLDSNGNQRTIGALDAGAVESLAEIVVDTLSDVDDGDFSAGNLSLREAIDLVTDGGTITFSNAITGGSAAGVNDGVIAFGSQLVIDTDMTINGDTNGDGKADITLDGGGTTRLIRSNDDLTLRSLDIANGFSAGGGGGAIDNSSDDLTLINSTVRNSAADTGFSGGGITSIGALRLENSTISGNSGNYGGGIYLDSASATLINTTLSGNVAGSGGGLTALASIVTLNNSTITENVATATSGGGIALFANIGTVTSLTTNNSIISANSATGGGDDISKAGDGTQTITTQTSLLGTGVVADTIFGVNVSSDTPGLNALADNGGTVQTHGLLPGSQAISGGNDFFLPTDLNDLDGDGNTAEALPIDANGQARIDGMLDIGAVEGLTNLVVDSLSNEQDGDFSAGDFTLREALQIVSPGGTITFDSSITGGNTSGVNDGVITLTGFNLEIINNVTINGDTDGDLKADIIIDGNDSSRLFDIQSSDATLRSLTLIDGNTTDAGGAIQAADDVSLVNSTIQYSYAAQQGGAIIADNITLANVSLFANEANSFGGALYARSGGTVTLDNVTASSNDSSSYGGFLSINNGVVTARNSTITKNTASDGGGAIELYGSSSQLVTLNSIITDNTSTSGDADVTSAGPVTAQNSLLGTGVTITNDDGGNLTDNIAGVGTPDDNGGPVKTRLPEPNSLILDAGDASLLAADALDVDGDGDTTELLPIAANGLGRTLGVLDIGAAQGTLSSLVVDTLADEDDGDYSAGDLSLREAISLIESGGTITFADSITDGATAGLDDGTITLGGTRLQITRAMTIDGDTDGDGKADITIDADGASRAIFTSGGALTDVTLRSLDITNGFTTGSGGAIESLYGGALTLINSTIRDSEANFGGGLRSDDLTVINSTFSNNTANNSGGGLSLYNNKTAVLENTTFSGNSAPNSAGGAILAGAGSMLTVSNSTITENSALNVGGGINVNPNASLTVENSIISGNTANVKGDISEDATATITAQNSLLGTDVDIDTDNGGNIIFNTTGLAALADNGGVVETHALLFTSAAIGGGDASLLPLDTADLDGDGDVAEALPLDANGEARVNGGVLDIGAVQRPDDFGVTPESAGTISAGGTATGTIEISDDEDWFAINLAAGTTYLIDVNGAGGGGGTLGDSQIVSIYDAAGVSIPGTFDDDGGPGSDARLVFEATQTGLHHIAAGAFSNFIGTYTVSVTVGPFPDLTIGNFGAAISTVDAGDTIDITYDVTNIGTGDGAPSTTDIYLSTNNFISTGDTLIASEISTGSVLAGATDNEAITVTLPGNLTPGTYFIGGIADAPNALFEENEGNNVSTDPVEITVTAPLSVTLFDGGLNEIGTFATIAEAVAAASPVNVIDAKFATYGVGGESVTVNVNNIVFSMDAGTELTATLGAGVETVGHFGDGKVTFIGNDENNALLATGGDDSLVGGIGDDTLTGGEGADTLDGGADRDAANYAPSDARVEIDLALDTADGGHAIGDELDNIEDIIGSNFNDLILGDGLANTIDGRDSVDNINGRGGDDSLLGGEGADLISGGNDNDTLDGGTENDALRGNGGADSILGGMGEDSIFGGVGNDFVDAGMGADTVLGQGNNDTILGDIGNDTIRGGSGNDSIEGGDDNDQLFGNGNNDTILGGEGNDSIQGNAGADRLFGDAGDDTLSGGVSGDRLDGGTGNDVLNGGTNDGVRDVFVFMVGYDEDRINAFDQVGTDRIELDENLWSATPGLTAQQVVDTFGSLNPAGNILTLDFGGGDILEIQNSAGINQATFGSDIAFI